MYNGKNYKNLKSNKEVVMAAVKSSGFGAEPVRRSHNDGGLQSQP